MTAAERAAEAIYKHLEKDTSLSGVKRARVKSAAYEIAREYAELEQAAEASLEHPTIGGAPSCSCQLCRNLRCALAKVRGENE